MPNFKKQIDRDPFVKDGKILMVKTQKKKLDLTKNLENQEQPKKDILLKQSKAEYNPVDKLTRPKASLSVPAFDKMNKRDFTFLKVPLTD